MSWCFYLFLSSVLRQPFSLFTACSTRHCGTSACCLRWRWEGSLLCLRVGFSFLCGSAGGWAESLSCYFLTSFATSFVKLLTEGLPGIHQRFIPKKRFVCSRESTKRFLRFFSWKWCQKNACFKITYLPSLQWKLDAILTPPDWSPMLGKKPENLVRT